jgi:hypothetical protein
MKEIYLNGKDVNVDADFFVGLGADKDNIRFEKKPMGEHTAELVIDGVKYIAEWNEWTNRMDIKCADLSYQDGEIADQLLYGLSRKLTQDMFGDLVVRKFVAWPEGMMPELVILFYEK